VGEFYKTFQLQSGTPEGGGMTKAFTLPIQKGGNGVEVPFHKRIIGNVMFIKIDLKQIHNVFCNYCYYFWDQHCCCTETSI